MSDLAGKIAVVTGGAAGIGRSIAGHLARLGAAVVIGDVSDASGAVSEILASGGKAEGVTCDVADERSVTAFGKAVSERHGGAIDILVNNAGTNGKCNLIEEMSTDAWERTLRINVTGMMLVTRTFIPMLTSAGGGQIVNIASNTGRRGVPWRADYACSKWAVIGFTQTLAIEVARHNIRANVVNPGPVEGDRIEQILSMHADAEGRSAADIRCEWLEATPMKRFVKPAEVADVVAFLCSPQSRSMTGQGLEVSAGLIMH